MSNPQKMISCEVCPLEISEADIKIFKSMKMCPSCYEKEVAFQAINSTPEAQQLRVEEHNKKLMEHRESLGIIEKSQIIDQAIQLRTDLFTAQTTAIIELKAAIDADDSIPPEKKDFHLATILTERKDHFQKVIFDLSEEQVKKQNEMRAVITYLQSLTNKLRAEEREKLKLSDISYQPNPVKLSTPKADKPSKKKFDKKAIQEIAAKLAVWCVANGKNIVPLSDIQMTVVARNLEPAEVLEYYQKKLLG